MSVRAPQQKQCQKQCMYVKGTTYEKTGKYWKGFTDPMKVALYVQNSCTNKLQQANLLKIVSKAHYELKRLEDRTVLLI